MVDKPQTKEDLLPPFEQIGELGWDDRLRSFLASYDVPFPDPATKAELIACEERIGTSLLAPHRLFLASFGPLNLDYITIFSASDIRTPDEWFVESLPDEQRSEISDFIRVADAGGTGNMFTMHLATGAVHFLSHDPLGHRQRLECFDDLVRLALVSIHSSYYGWPDEDIQLMSRELMKELFGFSV